MAPERPDADRSGVGPADDDQIAACIDRLVSERSPLSASAAAALVAVIPEEVVRGSPERLAGFLDGLFDGIDAARELVDTLPGDAAGECHPLRVQALVPPAVLAEACSDLEAFFDQTAAILDDLDTVLARLHEDASEERVSASLARRSEELELEFRRVKHALKRLRSYQLTRRRAGELVTALRLTDDVDDLQAVVDFLWSLHRAASAFETVGLPHPHIRDYLEHLYQIEDWATMETLVDQLQRAVARGLGARGQSSG